MKYRFLCMIVFALSGPVMAQNKTIYSLQDMIALAQSGSPGYKLAATQRQVKKYEYQVFKSNFKPQISFYGNAPVYRKQYLSVVQPDGSIQFQPVHQNLNTAGFSLSQELPVTGGKLSLNTEFNQFYNFQNKFNVYNGTPVFLRLDQPLFGFNELKWSKKIEPLKLEEANRAYIQEIEYIAQQVTQLFFDVLDAQSNIEIARNNMINDSINYNIEKQRVPLGSTTEDRLLQLQLQLLKGSQMLDKARYDHKVSELKLRTYIGLKTTGTLNLIVPEEIPALEVDTAKAIMYAKRYRTEYISFQRKKLEAQRDVAKAKAARQQVNLVASFGLNRASEKASVIYSDPKSQQIFSIGFDVPVMDWGRSKARYNTASALEKLVDFNNDLDEANMTQEITTLVNNIELLKSNIQLAKVTDSLGKRRFTIASQLFRTGKLTITELNLAQSEKDNFSRSYISALREYWNAWFLLRRLTLYDFNRQEPIYILN